MAFKSLIASSARRHVVGQRPHLDDRDFWPVLDRMILSGYGLTVTRGYWRKLWDCVLVVDVASARRYDSVAVAFDFGDQGHAIFTHSLSWTLNKTEIMSQNRLDLEAVSDALDVMLSKEGRSMMPRNAHHGIVIRVSSAFVYDRISKWRRYASFESVEGGRLDIRAYGETWQKVVRGCRALERDWQTEIAFLLISQEENSKALSLAESGLDVEESSSDQYSSSDDDW